LPKKRSKKGELSKANENEETQTDYRRKDGVWISMRSGRKRNWAKRREKAQEDTRRDNSANGTPDKDNAFKNKGGVPKRKFQLISTTTPKERDGWKWGDTQRDFVEAGADVREGCERHRSQTVHGERQRHEGREGITTVEGDTEEETKIPKRPQRRNAR